MTAEISLDAFLRHVPDAGPRVQKMFKAWSSARHGRAVPRRADFDPVLASDLLRFVWIYRLNTEIDDYVCDLAGEDVHLAWGRSIKGLRLQQIVGDANYPTVRERWDQIRRVPMVMYGADAGNPAGGGSRFIERLVLPLADAADAVGSIIGVSLYDSRFDRRDYTPTMASHVALIPVDAFPE